MYQGLDGVFASTAYGWYFGRFTTEKNSTVNFFPPTVKNVLNFTANFFAVLQQLVNPIETLIFRKAFKINQNVFC